VQRKGSEEEEEEEEKLEAFLATSLQKSLRRCQDLARNNNLQKPIATFLEIFCNGFEIWFTKVFVFLVRML
jgi:hypothetical protein